MEDKKKKLGAAGVVSGGVLAGLGAKDLIETSKKAGEVREAKKTIKKALDHRRNVAKDIKIKRKIQGGLEKVTKGLRINDIWRPELDALKENTLREARVLGKRTKTQIKEATKKISENPGVLKKNNISRAKTVGGIGLAITGASLLSAERKHRKIQPAHSLDKDHNPVIPKSKPDLRKKEWKHLKQKN